MRAVLQRVRSASVRVEEIPKSTIQNGILVFLGIGKTDTSADVKWISEKITSLRIFEDENGKMNLSLLEIRGEVLVVPQFTLYGDCQKGRRPSFDEAAHPEKGEELYNACIELLKQAGAETKSGVFRAHMQVELVNDGPVTLLLDSRK